MHHPQLKIHHIGFIKLFVSGCGYNSKIKKTKAAAAEQALMLIDEVCIGVVLCVCRDVVVAVALIIICFARRVSLDC